MSDSRNLSEKETRPDQVAQDPGDRAPATGATGSVEAGDEGFRADLPLAILESVRHHDRPTEVLEDEDLSASLPRRLGLTGVVDNQIQRYQLARKRRERISADEVSDLLRLVLRRPDSEPILREAGQDLARHHGRKLLYRMATLARILPGALSSRLAKRTIRRLMHRIGGGADVRVIRNPFRVHLDGAVTARDELGIACVLYASAIEEAYQHATGVRPDVEHVECETRGDERCVWEVR